MNKIELFIYIYKEQQQQIKYLESVPQDIRPFIFDNEHANSIGMVNEKLIEAVFGEHASSIFWFLYDWAPGRKCGVDGDLTVINSIDDYIEWMKAVEFFE